MTDDTRAERMTAYTLEGPTGTHRGRSRQRLPHTIAADALLEHTGRPWQRVEYRELRRSPGGSVWEIEGKVLEAKTMGDGTHLRFALLTQYGVLPAVWFGCVVDGVPPVCHGQSVRVAAELATNTYRGKTSLQVMVRGVAR